VSSDDPPWISAPFVEQFRRVIDRQVRVLLLFGETDSFYSDFKRALSGSLGSIVEQAGDRVEIRVLPGQIHGFTSLSVQDSVLDETLDWLASTPQTSTVSADSQAVRQQIPGSLG
jgi:acetyl esterase/lipase